MLEKLLSLFATYPYDKALHTIYFSIIFIFTWFISAKLGLSVYGYGPEFIALGTTVIAAGAKEIYDGTKDNHTRDFMDLIAGIYLPSIVVILYHI